MDLQLVKNGLDFTQKRKKWVLALAAFGFTGYGVYKVYNLPSVMKKRKRLFKLIGSLISIAEAVSDSVETVGLVSRDLKHFLQSDTDRIPNSLKQISKITRSDEFSESVIRVTRALTMGILRGYGSEAKRSDGGSNGNSSFLDQVMDKLSTPAGSGFASVVVGSFARNLVMAFYSDKQHGGGSNLSSSANGETSSVSRLVDVVCDDKCKELIGDSIQLFVSTAVSVYLEKTMDINTYDDLFSGLTNPKHETKVRDMVVSVCNGAVETLVRTSHQVFENSDSIDNSNSDSSNVAIDQAWGRPTMNGHIVRESSSTEFRARSSFDDSKNSGWGSKMTSTLAVPSNRRFVLDLTGRVTFETVRSFLDFLLEKLTEGSKRSLNVVHDVVIERGLEAIRYATAKFSVVFTVCLSLCLHIMGGVWVLVPA